MDKQPTDVDSIGKTEVAAAGRRVAEAIQSVRNTLRMVEIDAILSTGDDNDSGSIDALASACGVLCASYAVAMGELHKAQAKRLELQKEAAKKGGEATSQGVS